MLAARIAGPQVGVVVPFPIQSDRTAWWTRAARELVPIGNSPSSIAKRSSTAVYQTGSAISVKMVEEIKPPIIATAMAPKLGTPLPQ